MAFKLYSDANTDQPVVACDVCGEKILDLWSGRATGSPSHDGQTTDVSVHHPACVPPPGAVTIPLIEFLKLFTIMNRLGDFGSLGGTDRLTVEYPTGRGFEV